MRLPFLMLAGLMFQVAHSQPLFTLSPDTVFSTKPASSFTMYNYAEFNNLSGDTLAMRWVKLQTVVSQPGTHGVPGLGDWTISLQDPTNFYNPANEIDSADFSLPPLATSTDKFIMQLYPNGQEGLLMVTFKIFALNDPDNFVLLNFDYTVTPAASANGEAVAFSGVEIFPNPVIDWLNLQNNQAQATTLQLYSADGKYLRAIALGGGESQMVELVHLPPGMYFLMGECNGQLSVAKFVKN